MGLYSVVGVMAVDLTTTRHVVISTVHVSSGCASFVQLDCDSLFMVLGVCCGVHTSVMYHTPSGGSEKCDRIHAHAACIDLLMK